MINSVRNQSPVQSLVKMWFNSENVSKPVIKIRAVPWVPFPRKAQDKAFHSPHAVTRKLPWWVGGTKLSFKHTPGSDTPCHCRVASGACSDLAPMLCPHNTAEHQAKMPPGTPAWLSTQARTPHHTPSDMGLPQVPLLSWVQGFWTSSFSSSPPTGISGLWVRPRGSSQKQGTLHKAHLLI